MAVNRNVFNHLISVLEKIMPLSVLFKTNLSEILFEEFYKKDTRILNQREIQQKAWFIVKGSAREFLESEYTSTEKTDWFWFANDFLFTTPGLFSHQPAQNSIKLLEDCHLVYIHIKDFKKLKKTAETELLVEKIRDYYAILRSAYYVELTGLTARQKYLNLFHSHPGLFNLARQKDIADFLGMTPDTLGRIRRNNK